MNKVMITILFGLIIAALAPACADEGGCLNEYEPVADLADASERIAQALQERFACDLLLELPEGEFEGRLELHGGVYLKGQGPDRTIIRSADPSDSADPVLLLSPTTERDVGVDGLGIRTAGQTGIRALGPGRVELGNLIVQVEGAVDGGGTAIELQDLSDFAIRNARASGNVSEANAGGISEEALSGYALQGLAVNDCALGLIDGLSLNGFAWRGAAVEGAGAITWTSDLSESVISDSLRIGLLVGHTAALTVSDLHIRRIWQGTFADIGFGAVVYDGGSLTGAALSITNSRYIGLFGHDAAIELDGLSISGALMGVWSQKSENATTPAVLSLSHLDLQDLQGIGIGAHSLDEVRLEAGRISGVEEVSLPSESGGDDPMGDGIQILDQTAAIRVTGLTLTDCERAAILIDPAPGQEQQSIGIDADYSGTVITGKGRYGFVAQNADSEAVEPELVDFEHQDDPTPDYTLPVKTREGAFQP